MLTAELFHEGRLNFPFIKANYFAFYLLQLD